MQSLLLAVQSVIHAIKVVPVEGMAWCQAGEGWETLGSYHLDSREALCSSAGPLLEGQSVGGLLGGVEHPRCHVAKLMAQSLLELLRVVQHLCRQLNPHRKAVEARLGVPWLGSGEDSVACGAVEACIPGNGEVSR